MTVRWPDGVEQAVEVVGVDRVVEVLEYLRTHPLAPDVVADGFREQTGHVLVSLSGKRLELVPGVRVDFRADFDTLHICRMVDRTRYVKSAGWSDDR